MVNILRRWNQPIMVVVTVLVIVAFANWGPNRNQGDHANVIGAKLYGQDIRLDEWKRNVNRVGVFGELDGLYIHVLNPFFDRDRKVTKEMVARSMVLDRECDALGITSTEAERQEALKSLRVLFFNGQFDDRRYQLVKEKVLHPNGFTEGDLERVFLDGEVRAKKICELIGRSTNLVPTEVRDLAYVAEMKLDASYVVFKRDDLRKEMKVTDDELKKSYDENKGQYLTPETRKVRYAAFLLPPTPDGKPLTTKDRRDALQKLADTAYNFAQELTRPGANFEELAKKAGATVAETKDFFPASATPKELDENPDVATAAFQLTKEHPFSSQVATTLGSFVLELKEIKAPEQRTFEDAKKQIEAEIVNGKATEAVLVRAKAMQTKLAEALKAGKKFTEAAQALNLTVEEFPTVSKRLQPPEEQPYSNTIYPAIVKLVPGQITDALVDPFTQDALIAHLDARTAADDKTVAESAPELASSRLDGYPADTPPYQLPRGVGLYPPFYGVRSILFVSWLKSREIAAGMDTAFVRNED